MGISMPNPSRSIKTVKNIRVKGVFFLTAD
jgi:hypothetical protein